MNEDQELVLSMLSETPIGIQDIVNKTGLTYLRIDAALMMLQVKGFVLRYPKDQYIKIDKEAE